MGNEEPDDENVSSPSTDGEKVRDLTLADCLVIGGHLSYLQVAGEENYAIGEINQNYILNSLGEIENRLRATSTAVTIADQITVFRDELISEYEGSSTQTQIDDELGNELTRHARSWFELIYEKIENERRIPIPNSWLLDFELLMERPDQLFATEVWNAMDEAPRRDIIEACRALPMNCPTSTVMVSLRAVEHYLQKLYESETDEELDRGTWGRVLDELMEMYVDENDSNGTILQQLSSVPSILSNLYYLKEKRDEVIHLDESPTAYEAAITLFMVVGTINEVWHMLNDGAEN
ncbi:hypothetical protein [Halorussus sp. AFM4]|uniref:hypothetical protein n=1 Tax=Halorussus sp. AFM4 TaxID=3421651 RepID=UPI003EB6CF79